jgi:hypothetical protein
MLRTDVLLMSDSTTVAVGTVARSVDIGGPDGCEHAQRDRYASADLGEFLDAQLAAQASFRRATPNVDDLTLLAIRRLEPSQHVELVSAVDRRRRCTLV